MRERIKWIDVVKFFGIFAIYMIHYGEKAGKGGNFALAYCVPLFFLVSGCMENMNKEENIVRYVLKKVTTILVPCFFFACATVMIKVVDNGYGLGYIKGSLLLIIRGIIRNTFENGSLWFLTCLFSIQMMFFLVKRLKYKSLMIMVCIGLYYTAIELLPVNPMYAPSWPFNVDSALFYMLYYAIGYLIYPYVVRLFVLDTTKKKVFFCVLGGFSVAYTIGLYFGTDIIVNFLYPIIGGVFFPVLTTCIIIWANFTIARVVQDVEILSEIGKNTLYLCGSEYIIKYLISNFATLVGIQLSVTYPLQTYLYIWFLLVVTNKYIVPIEKKFLKKVGDKNAIRGKMA